MIPQKRFENTTEGKRRKLKIEDYMKEFKEMLTDDKSKIKYCKIEKCKITTEKGKEIFKKGQMISQALIKDTVKHLENLEESGIIRKSSSTWRTSVRALRKPNGSIRLVSNLGL